MGDGSYWLFGLLLAFLLLAGGYFAATEISFASANRIRIKSLSEHGDRRAARALYVLDNFDKAITTILIGNNIAHIASASIVTLITTRLWGVNAVTISTVITAVVVFFVAEMLPKSLAKKYCDHFALAASGLLCGLMKLFTPLSFLLTAIGRGAAKLTTGAGEVSVTEDELHDIIENLTEEGSLDEEQGDLVHSALEFDEITAGDILTARVDVAAVDIDDSVANILATIKKERHSRLPVYRDSIDNIVGVLQIRKFLKAYIRDGEALKLEGLLDDAYFIHESAYVDEVLPALSAGKTNMAVVTDSYGGTRGILTVEDILEELVGEIWDEDDIVVESFVDCGDGCYDVDASLTVGETFDELGFEDPEDDDDLIHKLMGQWAYEQLERIPNVGDSFEYHGLCVTVSERRGNRIMKLRVKYAPEAPKGEDTDE